MRYLALVWFLSLPVLADIAAPPAPVPAAQAQHPQGIEKVPMGVIEGGWAYVYAAWGAGLLGLVGYAVSLYVRRSEAPPPGAP